MRQMIVACRTLQDEIEAVMKRQGLEIPIVWIPSGLHNVPANLKETIQETLNALPQTDQVLLAMAYCGNAIAGIRTGGFTLTVPRMDDCISLLLGSPARHNLQNKGVYFMTAGWLRGERNLMTEYRHVVEKYGQKRGETIFRVMFQHYRDIALLNTGCFDPAWAEAEARSTAETLHLGYREIQADLGILERLLTGPWPEDTFLTVPPHTTIATEMLSLMREEE